MLCQLCGEEPPTGQFTKLGEDTVYLCRGCREDVEENDRVTGRYIVLLCPGCHRVLDITFRKYKPRGPKKGSHIDPRILAKRRKMAPFETFKRPRRVKPRPT